MSSRVGVFAAVVTLVLVATLVPAPASGFAQQMTPHVMVMLGRTLQGTVTEVRYASCGEGPATCQGIFEVAPASEAAMTHSGTMPGDHVMAHPVRVIVVPGRALMYQGAPLPLTRLHAGDNVMLAYQTLDNMNIVLSGVVTGMGRMRHM